MAEEKGTQLGTEGTSLRLEDGVLVGDEEEATDLPFEDRTTSADIPWDVLVLGGQHYVEAFGDYATRGMTNEAAITQLYLPACAWGEVVRIRRCAQCDTELDASGANMCGGCLKVRYCNKHCQRLHWLAEHKLSCAKIHT
jgi:hypothetical protein